MIERAHEPSQTNRGTIHRGTNALYATNMGGSRVSSKEAFEREHVACLDLSCDWPSTPKGDHLLPYCVPIVISEIQSVLKGMGSRFQGDMIDSPRAALLLYNKLHRAYLDVQNMDTQGEKTRKKAILTYVSSLTRYLSAKMIATETSSISKSPTPWRVPGLTSASELAFTARTEYVAMLGLPRTFRVDVPQKLSEEIFTADGLMSVVLDTILRMMKDLELSECGSLLKLPLRSLATESRMQFDSIPGILEWLARSPVWLAWDNSTERYRGLAHRGPNPGRKPTAKKRRSNLDPLFFLDLTLLDLILTMIQFPDVFALGPMAINIAAHGVQRIEEIRLLISPRMLMYLCRTEEDSAFVEMACVSARDAFLSNLKHHVESRFQGAVPCEIDLEDILNLSSYHFNLLLGIGWEHFLFGRKARTFAASCWMWSARSRHVFDLFDYLRGGYCSMPRLQLVHRVPILLRV
jgi:hypothetical protein